MPTLLWLKSSQFECTFAILQSPLWVFLRVHKRDVLTNLSIHWLPQGIFHVLPLLLWPPGQCILPWILFKGANDIPHNMVVVLIFAEGVFSWSCHCQEYQGYYAWWEVVRMTLTPIPHHFPSPCPLLPEVQSSQYLSVSPFCSFLLIHLPIAPLSKPVIIRSHN